MTPVKKIPTFGQKILNRYLVKLMNSEGGEAFVFGTSKEWSYQTVLYLQLSDLLDHKLIMEDITHDFCNSEETLADKKTWDIIFVSTFFDRSKESFFGAEFILERMSKDGVSVFIFPSLHYLKQCEKKGLFKKNGVFPTGILNLPDDFLGDYSYINPILVCFIKTVKHNSVFFTDYEENEYGDNIEDSVSGHRGMEWEDDGWKWYTESVGEGGVDQRTLEWLLDGVHVQRFPEDSTLSYGFFESLHHFPGFVAYKFITELAPLYGGTDTYKNYFLKDIINKIKFTKVKFSEKEDAIYIPLIRGKQKSVLDLEKVFVKHQNICQVILDTSKVLPRYLFNYLNSEPGRVIWEYAVSEANGKIQKLSNSEVGNLLIALPSLENQEKIADLDIKIDGAVKVLNGFQKKLAFNPISSKAKQEKLDSIINDISNTFIEYNDPLLCEESIVHEFKASLRMPYPEMPEFERKENGKKIYRLGQNEFESEKQIHKFLQDIVLKTVASFLNTKGGKLVIGVHEFGNEKEVVGIERELFKSHDHYQRHLTGLFKDTLSSVVTSNYITTKIVKINKIPCCVVECEKYPEDVPIYFKDKVYVRIGPRIDELVGQSVAQFILERQRK